MSDTNRIEAQAELREVIADAFAAHTLWTTDWAGVQLKRCGNFYLDMCSVLLILYGFLVFLAYCQSLFQVSLII